MYYRALSVGQLAARRLSPLRCFLCRQVRISLSGLRHLQFIGKIVVQDTLHSNSFPIEQFVGAMECQFTSRSLPNLAELDVNCIGTPCHVVDAITSIGVVVCRPAVVQLPFQRFLNIARLILLVNARENINSGSVMVINDTSNLR